MSAALANRLNFSPGRFGYIIMSLMDASMQ